jgi:hypothetical protein
MHAIKSLWFDAGFQAAYTRRIEYQLHDNFQYSSINIERLPFPNYVPQSKIHSGVESRHWAFMNTTCHLEASHRVSST